MESLKNLGEFLIKNIVKYPDEVSVSIQYPNPNACVLQVSANQEDIPLIIGKKGVVIRSLRTIIRTLASQENKFFDISILEK